MITQTYIVNMRVGAGIAPKVKISQGDIGRNLAFKLFDGVSAFTPPAGSTAEITGRKPSGLGFSENCTMSGNTVTVSTTLDISQESGDVLAELKITNGSAVVGTANFLIYVEPAAHPDGTTDGTTAEARTVLERCESYAQQAQEAAEAASGDYTEIRSDVDDLSANVDQLKADLDDLDDRVTALEEGGGSGLTDDVKTALMNLANHVAWDDDDPTGQTYITALQNALYPPADLVSISAVYTQSGTVYDTDTLDSLKSDLVVTALMSDQTTRPVTDYTLSGTLTEGTSTITVSYGGKTTTFTVTVSVYSTAPVIAVQNAYIYTDYTTPSYNGFGVTKKYEYLFSESIIENCAYYDSTNDYMTTNGWAGIKYYTADVNTVASGVSWPSGGKAKNSLFKDSEGAGYGSITKNSEAEWKFNRYSTKAMRSNGLALTLPLLDLDDCYAYWYKPVSGSILPDGVAVGDIIFAGANTQYYGKHNIND